MVRLRYKLESVTCYSSDTMALRYSAPYSATCTCFIGVELLYNVGLVSSVQHHESPICTHISPPSWAFLPALLHRTPVGRHRAPSWAPCITASHQLSVLLMVVYLRQCYSLRSCHLSFPTVSTSPLSMSVALFLLSSYRHFWVYVPVNLLLLSTQNIILQFNIFAPHRRFFWTKVI